MALPSSGQISMGDINVELGRSRTSRIELDDAENGSYASLNPCSPVVPSSGNPARMSEWRGYNHSFACCNAPSISLNSKSSSSISVNISYSNCQATHLEWSSNGGGSWSSSAGGCTSPRSIGSLSASTTYLIRVRITCTSTQNYSGYSNILTVTTDAGCPAYGTYLSQYCSGCTLYYRYADGSCGYYDVSQGCTTGCGGCCCSPAYGTLVNWYCVGGASVGQYSDGCNGLYEETMNPCDPSCGCDGGCVGKGCI